MVTVFAQPYTLEQLNPSKIWQSIRAVYYTIQMAPMIKILANYELPLQIGKLEISLNINDQFVKIYVFPLPAKCPY